MALFVQGVENSAGAASTVTSTFGSNIGVGKRLIVCGLLDYRPSAGGTLTLSDSLSTSFTQACTVDLLAAIRLTIHYGVATYAGGANAVTASYGGVNQTTILLSVHEYAHMDTTSAVFDQGTAAADATGTSTALNSGNVVTLFPNELIFGFGVGGAGVMTAGSNEAFALRVSASGHASEDAIKGQAGTTSAQMTCAAAGVWVMGVATFRRRYLGQPSGDADGRYFYPGKL